MTTLILDSFVYGTMPKSTAKNISAQIVQGQTVQGYRELGRHENTSLSNFESLQHQWDTTSQTSVRLLDISTCHPDFMNMKIFQSPAFLPHIPAMHMPLLEHFIFTMTRCISCHTSIQTELCSVFVPMALETPHLLAAVLCISASHRSSLGIDQSTIQIDYLRTESLKQLQSELAGGFEETTMATTLLLCLDEIVSGGEEAETLRVYLQGAASIHKETAIFSRNTKTCTLLKRLYLSIEAIALSYGMLEGDWCLLTSDEALGTPHIDELASFSTALLPVFAEINTLTKTRTGEYTNQTREILVERVEAMLILVLASSKKVTVLLGKSKPNRSLPPPWLLPGRLWSYQKPEQRPIQCVLPLPTRSMCSRMLIIEGMRRVLWD